MIYAVFCVLLFWQNHDPDDHWVRLTELTPEELSNIEVLVADKTPQKIAEVPRAVYVLTQTELQNAGVTHLVDALRLVPGVFVGQIQANQWASGVRGFNSRLSRSLLVLVDGRSVYNPLFAGVYWELQDTLIADIARIEVILGPAGSIWGSNAMNGVINIVTQAPQESQGGLVEIGGGSVEASRLAFRYGGTTAGGAAYRVYGKGFDVEPAVHAEGDAFDAWDSRQIGWAVTRRRGDGEFRWQGDVYRKRLGEQTGYSEISPPRVVPLLEQSVVDGANLVGRWERPFGKKTLFVRSFVDWMDRNDPQFHERRLTADFELRVLQPRGNHRLQWGGGYRYSADRTTSPPTLFFDPADDQLHIGHLFVADHWQVPRTRLSLNFGMKMEANNYTDLEWQPKVSAIWRLSERLQVWAAVSRAVRLPSRLERGLEIINLINEDPATFTHISANPDFQSEEAVIAEWGLRRRFHATFASHINLFHGTYRNLLSIEVEPATFIPDPEPGRFEIPFTLGNGLSAEASGGEWQARWQPNDDWLVKAHFAYLDLDLALEPWSTDPSTAAGTEGSSPHQQAGLHAYYTPNTTFSAGLLLRYVGDMPAVDVDAYWQADLHLSYRVGQRWQAALTGNRLRASRQSEFDGQIAFRRAWRAKLSYRW